MITYRGNACRRLGTVTTLPLNSPNSLQRVSPLHRNHTESAACRYVYPPSTIIGGNRSPAFASSPALAQCVDPAAPLNGAARREHGRDLRRTPGRKRKRSLPQNRGRSQTSQNGVATSASEGCHPLAVNARRYGLIVDDGANRPCPH
jgi:hypothetical protein